MTALGSPVVDAFLHNQRASMSVDIEDEDEGGVSIDGVEAYTNNKDDDFGGFDEDMEDEDDVEAETLGYEDDEDEEMLDAPFSTTSSSHITETTNHERIPSTSAFTHDLGNLLITSSTPLGAKPSNALLSSHARDAAESLIHTLLTTCPIKPTTTSALITLPAPTTALPRAKPLPKPKPETRWAKFAKARGIRPKRRDERNAMVYDKESGEWDRKWGAKRGRKEGQSEWLVEVNEKNRDEGAADGRGVKLGKVERKERMRRQDRRERANERRAAKA